MPDRPQDTQAQRMPGGKPGDEGLPDTPRDTAGGAVRPQDGAQDLAMDRPVTEVEASEPMTNEPMPVAEDGPGVALTPSPDETIDGNRGM